MEIKAKTAIVTGSTGPIGRAVCLMLAEAGCDVVCHYRKEAAKAAEIAETCRQSGVRAVSVGGDLTKEDQVESLFEAAFGFSKPSILANCVGIFERRQLSDVSAESFGRVMDANVLSVLLSCREFVRYFKRNAGSGDDRSALGRIVNIADVGGIRPWAGYAEYCGSKAALIAVTKSLAKELAPAITVNAAAPGIVSIPEGFDQAAIDHQIAMIPAGRIGSPKDVAEAVRMFIENDYTTGQVLNVDGGRVV